MEEYTLQQNLPLLCVAAHSFPEGIGAAFDSLTAMLSDTKDRSFFGISYPDTKGGMIYQAAVLQTSEDESRQYACDTFTLPKGRYLTETVKDWRKQEEMIGMTFRKMGHARPDAFPPIVEWYKGEDVMCMLSLGT